MITQQQQQQQQQQQHQRGHPITVSQENIEEADHFPYLGSILSREGDTEVILRKMIHKNWQGSFSFSAPLQSMEINHD